MKLTSCALLVLASILCYITPVPAQEKTGKPFPQHVTYAKGTIKPNHKSQKELDTDVVAVYERWKKNYLTEAAGAAGEYYIKYQPEGAVTCSEAHGYGMVTMVYMAGADRDAKRYFDGMFKFFKAHPSNGNPALMNWQQAIKDGKVVSVGGSCATDGDMDIAYALLLADKQWGSQGAIDYKSEAIKVISALKESTIHTKYKTLKMGDWSAREGSKTSDATRPSDFMFQHMKAYKKATGDPVWDEVVRNSYAISNHIFKTYSSQTGLLPDFAEYREGQFIPAVGRLLEAPTDGSFSYNAARTPWRIGTDYITTGDHSVRAELVALNTWIRKTTGDDPEKIKSGYHLDGTVLAGRDYQDLTYQSPLMISAMIDQDNQQWLNKLWDNAVLRHNSYFGDSITMLCLITASGNWWMP